MPERAKKGADPEISAVSADKMVEALENLNLALTSPKMRAPGTRSSYLTGGRDVLTWLGDRIPPSEQDLRRYFAEKRKAGMGEGSLRTRFAQVKKLCESNRWDWPFTNDDRPDAPTEVKAPAFTEEEVATLIRNRLKYTVRERFYLALATVLGVRREDMARVSRKDIKGNTIFIRTAHKGIPRWHLIPDEIMPVITAYKPKAHTPSPLSAMFQRIRHKGLGGNKKGYGWHSIRRTLDTLLPIALAREGLPLTFAAEYLRWARKSTGTKLLGSPMAGHYTHPEILWDDPYALDKIIIPIHPLLRYWRE